jgi:hypothetical protein
MIVCEIGKAEEGPEGTEDPFALFQIARKRSVDGRQGKLVKSWGVAIYVNSKS